MKINKIETEAFAGIQDRELEFDDGINLIVGENETGKSTIVDLIYNMFFQTTNTKRNKDRSFLNLYFPNKDSEFSGDFINGKVVFENDKGKFTLEKEWNDDGGETKLTTPDKTKIKNAEQVEEIIDKELRYGKGVFNELIFSSQKRDLSIIRSLLDGDDDNDVLSTKDELSSIVAKAAMETGGVKISELEKKIQGKIDSYTGHWDFSLNRPEKNRGINNPYKTGNGNIINAYYEKENAKADEERAIAIERRIDDLNGQKEEIKKQIAQYQKKIDEYNSINPILKNYDLLNKRKSEHEKTADKYKEDHDKWVQVEKDYDVANTLYEELNKRITYDLYYEASDLQERIEKLSVELSNYGNVTDDEINEIINSENKINRIDSALSSLDLSARLKKLKEVDVEVYSLLTGNKLEIDDEFTILEAVKIVIPELLEIELTPNDVDVEKMNAEKAEHLSLKNRLFEKYKVKDLKELQELKTKRSELGRELDNLSAELKIKLSDKSFEEVKKQREQITYEPEKLEIIKNKIEKLDLDLPIFEFVSEQGSVIKYLQREYSSLKELEVLIADLHKEIAEEEKQLEQINDIPEELLRLDDPERYYDDLNEEKAELDEKLEVISSELNEEKNEYREFEERSSIELREETKEKEELFERTLADYDHWVHIREVFESLKNSGGNGMTEDIADRFKKYLSLISSGNIKLKELDSSLNSRIASGNNALTYETLSQGTKETIYMAFRLAMLEHLYPDGGGLAVFDDLFTNMDPERTRQACKLVNEFAKKNQVIFVTCDPKYEELLDAKTIDF